MRDVTEEVDDENVIELPPYFGRVAQEWRAPRSYARLGRTPEHALRFNAESLMEMEFPPIRFIVPGYCAEGLNLLAARAKMGKSWLALDWLLACSLSGIAMGSVSVEIGDCLYLALEDGPRRLQTRIRQLLRADRDRKSLERLTLWTSAPRLDQGLLKELSAWAAAVPAPRLIVIDVFAKVRPANRNGENAYDADYRALSPLQEWATRNGIAVVLLHHTRKAAAEDPLEMLSGSNGVPGAADTILVLNKDANGTTLYVRGRDVEEKETALRFDEGQWIVAGDAADLRRSSERGKIISVLNEANEPMSPADIAGATGMKPGNVRFLLHKLGKEGVVEKAEYGKYRRPISAANTANTANTWGENG